MEPGRAATPPPYANSDDLLSRQNLGFRFDDSRGPSPLIACPGVVGVDLSGSIRVGLPNITAPLKGGEETVFGVWGGLGRKMANAWEAASREDYLRAVEFASPAFLENMLKAARMATQGATTPAGKVLFDEKGTAYFFTL